MQHCSRPKGWVARYIHILFVFVSFISSALLAVLAVISSRPRYVTPHGFGSIGSTLKIPALPKTAHRRFYFMAKRVIDIIVSLLVLVTVSPLMLVIILVIKLTSLGPAVSLRNALVFDATVSTAWSTSIVCSISTSSGPCTTTQTLNIIGSFSGVHCQRRPGDGGLQRANKGEIVTKLLAIRV